MRCIRDNDLYFRLLDVHTACSSTLVELDMPRKLIIITVCHGGVAVVCCSHWWQLSLRYDSRRRSWRHIDAVHFKTLVEFNIPRVRCSEQGVVQVSVQWAKQGHASRTCLKCWLSIGRWLPPWRSLERICGWVGLPSIASCNARSSKGMSRRQTQPMRHLCADETSISGDASMSDCKQSTQQCSCPRRR